MKMKLLRGYFRAKGLLEDFAKEERGGAEIIAIILIIVVVIGLAAFFRDGTRKLLRTSWRESRARREAFRADSYGTLQNYPYTAKMRCTDSAPKKRKEWRNERHFAGKVE